jgi:hypothetical protein
MEVSDATTLTPQGIVDGFSQAYQQVYKKCPTVRYMGNAWYQVNGELLHRAFMLQETARLHDLARQQRAHTADRSVISRLIAKLRGM